MNPYFDENKIEDIYPQAGQLMWPPMLCWHLPKNKEHMMEQVCESGDYFGSIKKDGLNYQIVKTQDYLYMFGRTISKHTDLLTQKAQNVPHITKAFNCLPPNTVLVAEIYYPGGTSKNATTILGCLEKEAIKRQERQGWIHAYIHDILMYDGVDLRRTGALDRYKILEAIWKLHEFSSFDFLELAQPIYENILDIGIKAIQNGEEGLVLRKKDAPWSPSKRPAWVTLKLKKSDSVDLVCAGICEPTKIYTGIELDVWPYWAREKDGVEELTDQCQYGIEEWKPVTKLYYHGWPGAIKIGAYDSEGKLRTLGTVSSGLTDDTRRLMKEFPGNFVNKVVSLSCMSIDSKERTLRHPVLQCFRDDKDPKDCVIEEIFA